MHIRYFECTSDEAGCGLSSRNSHWSPSWTFSSQLFIYILPNQGPSKLQDVLINLFQALSLSVIHVTWRRKLGGGILVTVGLVSIHSIILPHLQAEHRWAASTCSSVNLQEVAGWCQGFSATCPPPVPSLCIFNPVALPFLSFVVHCTSFFLLVFVTFSLLPPWGGGGGGLQGFAYTYLNKKANRNSSSRRNYL